MAVLVIDDDPAVRAVIRRLLHNDGWEVIEAADGAEGISMAEIGNIELAIVDVFMPNMDGLEVIRAFRRSNPELPILAISGASFQNGESKFDFLKAAGAFGAVATLAKPFRPGELVDAVNALTKRENMNGASCPPLQPQMTEAVQLDLFASP